jgi:hypothetical protein
LSKGVRSEEEEKVFAQSPINSAIEERRKVGGGKDLCSIAELSDDRAKA